MNYLEKNTIDTEKSILKNQQDKKNLEIEYALMKD
jgi:hypothetical protein